MLDFLKNKKKAGELAMLGERISFLRIQKGMSQAELAQKLHLSPSTLGSYEQGRRVPSIDTLVALANIFSVTVDYLASGYARTIEDYMAVLESPNSTSKAIRQPLTKVTRNELSALLFEQLIKSE